MFSYFGAQHLLWMQGLQKSLYRTFVEKDRYMAFLKGIGVTLEISFFAVLLGKIGRAHV